MDAIVKKWVDRAKYDFSAAQAMLEARKYLYVAFACQQSLEKILKALMVSQGKKVLITHNLVRLAQEADVFDQLDEKDQDFLADLTPFAIEARYGDYRKNLSEIIDRKRAARLYTKTQKVFAWLKKRLK